MFILAGFIANVIRIFTGGFLELDENNRTDQMNTATKHTNNIKERYRLWKIINLWSC